MHYMLEEMGKDIVRKESIDPGKRSRLWNAKDVYQVLRYNKGINLIQGIKLDMSQIDNLRMHHSIFEGMINLRVIYFFTPGFFWDACLAKKLFADQVDCASLPDELRYLYWDYYPFKSLSGFNPKNLVVLKLLHGDIEHLWNDDDDQSLVNLREIDVAHCKKLRKIPSLLGAINLEILDCSGCESLVELPGLNHLASLKKLGLKGCHNLKTFPEVPKHFSCLELDRTKIEEVPDSIEHLGGLNKLCLKNSKVNIVSSNILKLESLCDMDLSHCPMVEFPELPRSLTNLNLSGTQIEEVCLSLDTPSNLQTLDMSGSGVKYVSIKMESLRHLNLSHCPMIEFLETPKSLRLLNLSGTQIKEATFSLDSLNNLWKLKMSSSSIQQLQCNINLFGSREIPTVDVSSPILMSKSIYGLEMDHCKSLKLLSELPPYIQDLDAHGCTSLEKVSFADQKSYQLDHLDDDDDDDDVIWFYMLFCNCFSLSQDSIDNIEANAMLKIGYLAEKLKLTWENPICQHRLFCCFPGDKISTNKFEYQSMSSLVLKLAPNGSSGNRFLVFSICLVADLTHSHHHEFLKFTCKYQLTTAGVGGYKKFTSEWISFIEAGTEWKYMGDHVLILFSEDMVKKDKDYEEASFEFYIENPNIKVKKCGVQVSYVDEEPSTTPTT
ncbi:disease resistance protein RPP2B-like [Gossypium arboreum]|uniref:disease resistance protein RPP2B-like n=1 Tax=Gossypium arboreum TaxID=29729 RepID=UPI000819142C|nr:disease resistance protein RPP2B-like [Gossypium arboreum]XP_017627886.1 disease resistance protein RPP2B-like [Gossypium arboreum]